MAEALAEVIGIDLRFGEEGEDDRGEGGDETSQCAFGSMLKALPITTPSARSTSATESPSSTKRMLATTTVAASSGAS
jgi:hypothetical protein